SPNLNNEKLQTSWGCIAKPEEVLKKMLKVGEYTELSQAIMDLSGLNDDDSSEDLVEEAKN
ncbi:phage portal protein, partial [Escherichia coli]|nr:phage portal protein [Escherichia coli]